MHDHWTRVWIFSSRSTQSDDPPLLRQYTRYRPSGEMLDGRRDAPNSNIEQLVVMGDRSPALCTTWSWITFDTADAEIFIVSTAGGHPRKLVSGIAHVWEPSGKHLYYFVREPGGGTRLQSIAIDERTGKITGQPQTIGLMTGILSDLAISRSGQEIALTEAEGSINLTRLL